MSKVLCKGPMTDKFEVVEVYPSDAGYLSVQLADGWRATYYFNRSEGTRRVCMGRDPRYWRNDEL